MAYISLQQYIQQHGMPQVRQDTEGVEDPAWKRNRRAGDEQEILPAEMIGGQEYIHAGNRKANITDPGMENLLPGGMWEAWTAQPGAVMVDSETGNVVMNQKVADKIGQTTGNNSQDWLAMVGMAAFGGLPMATALGAFGGIGLEGAVGAESLLGGAAADTLGLGSGIEGLTLADLAGEGLFTGLTDAQLAGAAGGLEGAAGGGLVDQATNLYNQTLGQAPPGTSTLAQTALDAEDAAQGAAMTQAGAQGGGAGINSALTTGGAAGNVASGAGSALSRILDGTATASDWASIAGSLGSTALGALGSINQTNALEDIANQNLALGAPSRGRFEGSFAPDFDIWAQPNMQGALDSSWDTGLRRLSATGGNPFGNPGGLAELNKGIMGTLGLPALNNYREQNRLGGSLGLPMAGQAQMSGVQSSGNLYNALGSGLAQLTAPRNDLASLLQQFGGLNLGGLV